MNMNTSGEQRSAPASLKKDELRFGAGFSRLTTWAKDPQTVETETGVTGYGWLGYIEIPTKEEEKFVVDVFQCSVPGLSFVQSCKNAPATRLSYTTNLAAENAVVLVPRNAMQELMQLNSDSSAGKTSEAEDASQFHRRNALPVAELQPGQGAIVGRGALFAAQIGANSVWASRQHYRVDVMVDGSVVVTGLSNNPTNVHYVEPQPQLDV